MSQAHDDPRPIGVLLVNLGSPSAPTTPAVRRYLRQFLSDPRVLDIPAPMRWLVLESAILPVRSRRSAALYRSIWDDNVGSPLLHHTRNLAESVDESLGAGWVVRGAMRYGEPSIQSAWESLRASHVRQIVVVPLYPQETSSTIGSVLDEIHRQASQDWVPTPMSVVPRFYDNAQFIEAWRTVASETLAVANADHVLFSFHSIPQRHITKADDTRAHCLVTEGCCELKDSPISAGCYRAQCVRTANRLAGELDLSEDAWSISFQSRLGRIPWVQPYTDVELDRLRAQGVRRLAVMCPAFVCDNLETVEEIGIRARRQWLNAGGHELILVPSLNAHPSWVEAVVGLVKGQVAASNNPEPVDTH